MTTIVNRIKLRHKRLSDAKEDYSWQTDPELAELDAALVLKMNYQQYLSEYTFDLCYPTSNRHEFAIESNSGEHIGNCVYYNVDKAESKAEIGIMIGKREYWNQGYGVESINLLLQYIFNHTGLERVYLTTLKWNIRAQKCFEKCGFHQCGSLARDGSDFFLMMLYKDEWEKLKKFGGEE
jgi:[ribosomal protein S5]-alanine N-acetyltransferase